MNKSIGVFVPFKMDLGELHNGSILPITPEGATVLDVWCARLKKLNEELGIPVYILTNDLTVLGMTSLNPSIQIVYWNQENEALDNQTRYKDIALTSKERFLVHINPQYINLNCEIIQQVIEEFDKSNYNGVRWISDSKALSIFRFDCLTDEQNTAEFSNIDIKEYLYPSLWCKECYDEINKENLTI